MTAHTLPSIPDMPIDGRMVWRQQDLAKDHDWLIHLTAEQCDQLHTALESAQDVPLDRLMPTPDQMPAWQPLTQHIHNELNQGRGVVLVRGLDAAAYSVDELQRIFWLIAIRIGHPMIQNAKGELLGQVIDRGHDYEANNVRGYTTNRALAFHCDASEVVGLLCVHPAKQGGTSHIACAAAVHNEILQHHPQYLPSLFKGYYFDLRGEGDGADHNEITRHRVPVYHYHAGRLSIRFNYKTIIDGMRKAGKPLEGIDLEAVNCVLELSRRKDLVFDMDFQPGDMQWLSNHDVLHARGEFIDWPEEARKRRLLRIWMNLEGGRALRDEFSDRFNNGPRNGPAAVPGAGYWMR